MKELDKEDLIVFSDLFELTESEDYELISANYVDREASESRDQISIFTFRSFNSKLDQLDMNKRIERLSDTEFAMFETKFIEDVLFVFAYI